MSRSEVLTRRLLPILAAAFALRALGPVGYMPAAPGTGLLFELCHEGIPVAIMVALAGDEGAHAHHGHHDHGTSDHGAAANGSCAIGHLLTLAMIDTIDDVDGVSMPAPLFGASESAHSVAIPRRYASPPRGPPA